jgi:hypothetical protein
MYCPSFKNLFLDFNHEICERQFSRPFLGSQRIKGLSADRQEPLCPDATHSQSTGCTSINEAVEIMLKYSVLITCATRRITVVRGTLASAGQGDHEN